MATDDFHYNLTKNSILSCIL